MTRIVVKIGTAVITTDLGQIDHAAVAGLAAQLAAVKAQKTEVVLVSSGAVSCGQSFLGVKKGALLERQAAAAVGQAYLIGVWREAFAKQGCRVAQLLLSRGDLDDRLRYLNARTTIFTLLKHGLVPILNENDPLAVSRVEGSSFGDNDMLGALIAVALAADAYLILSDVDGLCTNDPRLVPEAELLAEINRVTPEIAALAGGAGSKGTGGMRRKVAAAKLATEAGIETVLACGRKKDVVLDFVRGGRVGTRFRRQGITPAGRKRWLLAGVIPAGSLIIDQGAAAALGAGRSLLPVGVVEVRGDFARGEAVRILNQGGREVGIGVANYSAPEARKLKGQKSERLEVVLGYSFGEEIVHRDDLVLTRTDGVKAERTTGRG